MPRALLRSTCRRRIAMRPGMHARKEQCQRKETDAYSSGVSRLPTGRHRRALKHCSISTKPLMRMRSSSQNNSYSRSEDLARFETRECTAVSHKAFQIELLPRDRLFSTIYLAGTGSSTKEKKHPRIHHHPSAPFCDSHQSVTASLPSLIIYHPDSRSSQVSP